MSRTTSRLSTLKKVRAVARDERRRRLAEALQADAVLENQKDQIEQQKTTLRNARHAAASTPSVNLNLLADAQRYGLVLAAEQNVLSDQRTKLLAEVENRRQALIHADCEVRAVERLEQKYAVKERLEQRRSENRELDETAQATFNRRKV